MFSSAIINMRVLVVFNYNIMIYLFQLILVLGLISESVGECFKLNNCTCQEPTKVVCKLANLTYVPNNIGTNVNILWLDLAENEITILRNDSFVWKKANSLHHLNLQENNINTIEVDALKPLSNLTYLNLAANNLSYFPSELLKTQTHLSVLMLSKNQHLKLSPSGYNLPALTKLSLRHCKLRNIPNMFFQNMRNISELNIANNLISHLDQDLFASLPNLQYLSLANNRLTSLASVLNIPSSVDVELWGNPWHCDCKLATDFHKFSRTRDQNPLLCGFNEDNTFKINSTSYVSMCEQHLPQPDIDDESNTPWIITACVIVVVFVAIVIVINPVRTYITKRLTKLFHFLRNLECVNFEEDEEDELTLTDPHTTEMCTFT